jgi:hypothetical protein
MNRVQLKAMIEKDKGGAIYGFTYDMYSGIRWSDERRRSWAVPAYAMALRQDELPNQCGMVAICNGVHNLPHYLTDATRKEIYKYVWEGMYSELKGEGLALAVITASREETPHLMQIAKIAGFKAFGSGHNGNSGHHVYGYSLPLRPKAVSYGRSPR